MYLGAKLELTLVESLTRHQSVYGAKLEPTLVKPPMGTPLLVYVCKYKARVEIVYSVFGSKAGAYPSKAPNGNSTLIVCSQILD